MKRETPNFTISDVEQLGRPWKDLLCLALLNFLRELLSREKAFQVAVKAKGVEAARRHAERVVRAVGELVEDAFNQNLRDDWYAERDGLHVLQALEDAMRAARLNHRHWLTKLPQDLSPPTSQKDDPPRRILEAKAAAALRVFGAKPRRAEVADEIAKVLKKAGFKHKRGLPSAATVTEWMYRLDALSPDARPTKRNRNTKRASDWRFGIYVRAQQDYRALDFPRAKKDLERAAKRLSGRVLTFDIADLITPWEPAR